MPEGGICVGVISDTHGLIRPEVIAALQACDLIIHAGDVGEPEVLKSLRKLAPTVAVRGNTDKGAWAEALRLTEVVEVGRYLFYVVHELGKLDLDPRTAGFAAVIFGHSHRPSLESRKGVLYLNPGSAGPRRFNLPVAIGRVHVSEGNLRPEILKIDV
jgi:hypothetical protein